MQKDIHISDCFLAPCSDTAHTPAKFYNGDGGYRKDGNGQKCELPVAVEYYKEETYNGKKIPCQMIVKSCVLLNFDEHVKSHAANFV